MTLRTFLSTCISAFVAAPLVKALPAEPEIVPFEECRVCVRTFRPFYGPCGEYKGEAVLTVRCAECQAEFEEWLADHNRH